MLTRGKRGFPVAEFLRLRLRCNRMNVRVISNDVNFSQNGGACYSNAKRWQRSSTQNVPLDIGLAIRLHTVVEKDIRGCGDAVPLPHRIEQGLARRPLCDQTYVGSVRGEVV